MSLLRIEVRHCFGGERIRRRGFRGNFVGQLDRRFVDGGSGQWWRDVDRERFKSLELIDRERQALVRDGCRFDVEPALFRLRRRRRRIVDEAKDHVRRELDLGLCCLIVLWRSAFSGRLDGEFVRREVVDVDRLGGHDWLGLGLGLRPAVARRL
jgi:hypothetical protein